MEIKEINVQIYISSHQNIIPKSKTSILVINQDLDLVFKFSKIDYLF
jgi:hypothetical protein